MTNKSISRFDFWLDKLSALMTEAKAAQDPAYFLYTNDARTIAFMLEALAKLYGNLQNKKRFKTLAAHFKELEDLIGAVDHYDNAAKDFAENTQIPVTVTAYLRDKKNASLQALNSVLISNKWLKKNGRIGKIRAKLLKTEAPSAGKEIAFIEKFYHAEIEEIEMFVKEGNTGFTEMETQVHELRRKLRWLSIYPKALQGIIQLTETQDAEVMDATYTPPAIVNSPFVKMPEPGLEPCYLFLEKNYFFALSYVIAALGKIKDNGLNIFVLSEALEATENIPSAEAANIAATLRAGNQDAVQKLLLEASALIHDYMAKGYLKQLVVNVNCIGN